FQCTRSHSKRPKAEEDEEVSADVHEAEDPNHDVGMEDFKVREKPEAAAKLGNTEAPSEDRVQMDQHFSDNINVS
ncbi:Hypothetical predicted protein, partial [Marmota monax]